MLWCGPKMACIAAPWTKGEDETEPTEHVEWLCEMQGRERHIMVSTSKPMPLKGTAEDRDVQPPHRQAGNYYKAVARRADGSFKVTMESPSTIRPSGVFRPVLRLSSLFQSLVMMVGNPASSASWTRPSNSPGENCSCEA